MVAAIEIPFARLPRDVYIEGPRYRVEIPRLDFYAYETIGGCIGHTGALAMADFDERRITLEIEIPIKKELLLETLRKNREEHQQIYDEALAAYCKRAQEHCEALVAKLRKGEAAYVGVNFNPPENHVKDYDLAISMVEMAETPLITLNAEDFSMLVRDDWGWQKRWLKTSGSLIGGHSNSASTKCLAMYNE